MRALPRQLLARTLPCLAGASGAAADRLVARGGDAAPLPEHPCQPEAA